MHYLITGHTGFKGSWLALMLKMQGHTVSGIALDPSVNSLFSEANISSLFLHDLRLDIRDRGAMKQSIRMINPEFVIHLAAQPIVRESYRIPLETFDINVTGTLNVLEATRDLQNLKAVLIVTTDKVYKNQNLRRGYVETDELGGDDPYSASKAAADIASQSWIKSFATVPITIARAGNVIGGGDWAQDRIIPDLVKAYSKKVLPTLRFPHAIRPWQHVLDCLNGYLQLLEKQTSQGFIGEWNFGPDLKEKHSVVDLVESFASTWGVEGSSWKENSNVSLHETGFLLLDSQKARKQLSWSEKLDFNEAVAWTSSWYKSEEPVLLRTQGQIENFYALP